LSIEELWKYGWEVADEISEKRSAGLFGRVDVRAETVIALKLKAEAAPLPKNPNHAHVTGWSFIKAAQKAAQLELAKAAGLVVPVPPRGPEQVS
jgi:hypothetical protein